MFERASNGGRSMLQQALSHSISASEAPGISNLNSTQMAASSCRSADESQSPSSATVGQSGDNRSALHSTGCKSAGNNTPMPAFELNMRIGVHSGHIHSGVIGLKKWQFDVWSNDVSIAMHCESSGVPGRVQVTEATVLQLNGAFTYEIAPENARDSFLADKEIRTYLISDRIKRQENTLRADHLPTSIRRPSHKKDQQQMVAKRKKQSVVQGPLDVDSIDKEALLARGGGGGASAAIHDCNMDEDNIRAATIGTIRQTLLAGESASSSSALAFYGLIFNHHDMTPFMLNYRDPAMNKLYANRPINRWLRELTTIILLLAVLIPLLNWQLLVTRSDEKSAHLDYNAQVKFLLLIALISTVLMIASFKAPTFVSLNDTKLQQIILSTIGSLVVNQNLIIGRKITHIR
ncbi:hypothetical protein SUGI_1516670 [Cryptomeria japonica]|uniref:adenylate cyclase n=1 Tax=Cryptomeria japonica TaxID=3369 RepID=A0AAD3RQE1_CRYJA|nr:hypothetical protein SUGI_1516670 [Cryptomeria japonica]